MSKTTCKNVLIFCIFVGALYLADVFTMITAGGNSNFVVYSNAWVRYIILLIIILGINIIVFVKKENMQIKRFIFPNYKLLVLTGIVSIATSAVGVYHAYVQFVFPSTNFGHARGTEQLKLFALSARLIFAICILFFGIFLILLVYNQNQLAPKKSVYRNFALIGIFALCVLPIILYSEYPFSVHRIIYTIRACNSLFALTFTVKFVGLMFKDRTTSLLCSLQSYGISAFLMCTCINIPNTTYMFFSNQFVAFDFIINILFIFIGLLGAASAVVISEKA